MQAGDFSGEHDAEVFHAIDRNGWHMTTTERNDVGYCSALAYGEKYGFVCCVSMRQPCGEVSLVLARLLLGAMMYLGGDRLIGVSSTLSAVPTYVAAGFVEAHRVSECVTHIQSLAAPPADARLTRITGEHVPAVCEYDPQFFPGPRDAFVRSWTCQQGRIGMALIDAGRVLGYAVIRRPGPGPVDFLVGPLFADGLVEASLLLSGCRMRRCSESTADPVCPRFQPAGHSVHPTPHSRPVSSNSDFQM